MNNAFLCHSREGGNPANHKSWIPDQVGNDRNTFKLMKKTEIITSSCEETFQAGVFLAKNILANTDLEKEALVIGLTGDLGSGKTVFVQGLAAGLEIKEKITSPTFVILKKYNFSPAAKTGYFYHIDSYRLNSAQSLADLDFKEIVSLPKSVIAIEWAEKVKEILPKDVWQINFEYLSETERKIIIQVDEKYGKINFN